jgi:CheY-like chemotaxis protein
MGIGTTFHFTIRLPNTRAATTSLHPPTREGLRVLVADDNLINRTLAAGILKKHGHSVVLVTNGREAVEAVGREAFDMVFLDVQMPEMDGFAATRHIRDNEMAGDRRTPIVAMTAYAMTGDRERCLTAGMDHYLSKPLEIPVLVQLLEQASARRPHGRDQIPGAPIRL